jgi:hypothetical protein
MQSSLTGLGPPGQVLDVFGVDQPGFEPSGFQQVERWFPVVRRGLHDHPGHPQAGQPVGHRKQRAGPGGIGLHLLQPPPPVVLIGDPDAAHQLGLADIQRRHPLDDLLVVLCSGEHHGLLPWSGGRCPQGPWAQLEKSNPRARSDTERPVKRPPAPGLETTSAIKQQSASAGSNRTRFSARNGHPTRDIQGLGVSPRSRWSTAAFLVKAGLLVI